MGRDVRQQSELKRAQPQRILDRYLNVLPSFTIREGHRVKVVLSEDLLLPAYEKHLMPSDL